jgi:hypothetical protein
VNFQLSELRHQLDLRDMRELLGGSKERTVERTPEEPVYFSDEGEPNSAQLRQWEEENTSIKPDSLTDWEMARLERESQFDARIAKLKDEMANQLPYVERKGSEAPILHPGIVNLPHDIVDEHTLPDVEITI